MYWEILDVLRTGCNNESIKLSRTHTKYGWARLCGRLMVEPCWAGRESTRAAAERSGALRRVRIGVAGTTPGQPRRGRGEPRVPPSQGSSYVYRQEEMAKQGYKNCGTFKHLCLTGRTDKPHTCQTLTALWPPMKSTSKDRLWSLPGGGAGGRCWLLWLRLCSGPGGGRWRHPAALPGCVVGNVPEPSYWCCL